MVKLEVPGMVMWHARAQADDGYLYPLERAFFYVHKPPTLLVHDECEAVEFMRQGGGVLAASAKTFDLAIRMRNDQARLLCTHCWSFVDTA